MQLYSKLKVDDKSINDYLFFKNLLINRKYSLNNKKKINKLDHYQWWFQNPQSRKSFFILKDNRPICISSSDHYKYKNFNLIYSGLISCVEENNLFDILKSIKIQNEYLDTQKNTYCFISINKKNNVLMHHWKYFNYEPFLSDNNFFSFIKKKLNIKNNAKIFFKKIK